MSQYSDSVLVFHTPQHQENAEIGYPLMNLQIAIKVFESLTNHLVDVERVVRCSDLTRGASRVTQRLASD